MLAEAPVSAAPGLAPGYCDGLPWRVDARGRVRVRLGTDHHFANRSGWQWRYRFVVMTELARRLLPSEHVHHVDGVRDHDLPPNLEVLDASFHGRLHAEAIEVVGWRAEDGRFVEHDEPVGPFQWPRNGAVLGPAAREGGSPVTQDHTYRHLQLFCGIGGLSAGISDAVAEHAGLRGHFKCVAAIDSDAATIARYNRYTGTSAGQVVDLFDRRQYEDFHGQAPPPDWREVTVDDIRRLCGGLAPDVVCSSPPCKGFSGLLSYSKSRSRKYQALNRLVFRGFWLVLEAFKDDPPAFWLLENVPRIVSRGAHYLEQMESLFQHYGYSVTGSTHCCGEVGGLAQRRKRYLQVARHTGKVRPRLYQPQRLPLRTVGEVIGDFPLPGDPRGGALHSPRRVSFKTAVRLALIPAGRDWRALKDLRVEDGVLVDYALVPDRYGHRGALGVKSWNEPAGTVTGRSSPTTGSFAVAAPVPSYGESFGQLGICEWNRPSGTVTGQRSAGQGRVSVQDPRVTWGPNAHNSKLRVVPWDGCGFTVTSAQQVGSGASSIADPRPEGARHNNVFRVVDLSAAAPAVTAGSGPSSSGLALADPRQPWMERRPDTGDWRSSGHYGVLPFSGASGAVTASGSHDNGTHSVADPRLPEPGDVGVWVIVSLDDTWHRPFTTLELAALQSLLTPEDLPADPAELEEQLRGPASLLDGSSSDTAMRQWIGNAVPRATAQAIGRVILQCLLAEEAGESFTLSASPAWALPRELAILCSVDTDRAVLKE